MADTTPTSPHWVTDKEVSTLTGATVDDATIAQAQGVIELRTGVLAEQFPALWGRDARWLARAVAYQAAFMAEHPDMFSRMGVDSLGQDGQSMSGRGSYLTLAPLARVAIRRLSWKGTRSTTQEAASAAATVDDDELDGLGRPLPWRPLQ